MGSVHFMFRCICFLLVLRRNVPVNNNLLFSQVGTRPTLPGFNQYCRELMCLAQEHNTVTPVGILPRTSRFRVRRSTTTPPRSLNVALTNVHLLFKAGAQPNRQGKHVFALTFPFLVYLSYIYIIIISILSSTSENHRTQTEYDDALIIKLFAFQFANNYASCFYIAFFREVSNGCQYAG